MDFEDILGGAFPLQKFTSDAASRGYLGMIPQMAGQMSEGQQMGLMGLFAPQFLSQKGDNQQPQDPYAQFRPDQFLTQTPGNPNAPGRIDSTSFESQMADPMALLEANINRRFGG